MSPDTHQNGAHPVLESIGVPDAMIRSWQETLDLVSELFRVPAALISRVYGNDMEVCACNGNMRHPYRPGLRERLHDGRYCEEVARSRTPLLVADARTDPRWQGNPDLENGMVSYMGMPLTWPSGEIFGAICVLDHKENRHSRRRKRLLQQFAGMIMADLHILYASIQLERTDKELRFLHEEMNRFLGIAAHDMRNALNVFLGSSRHLLPGGGGLTRKQQTYLDLAQKSASTLLQLMDELMDIARIDSMHVPLHVEEVDLSPFIVENIRFNQNQADAKGIQINLLLPPEEVRLKADPAKLDQVFNNLLSNAMKFSPENSIVQVSVSAGTEEILVSVRDQGPGIPRNEQTGLFTPFQTTSIQPTSGETSTGLGLYITRRIIEEHGGQIWVESEPGQGSVFCFTLRRKTGPKVNLSTGKKPSASTV